MSFETWFFYYRNYILDLRSIFIKNFAGRFPDFREELYSNIFLTQFARKIYEKSSKRIPIEFVDELDQK